MASLHIEVQERACFLDQIITMLEDPEVDSALVCSEIRLGTSEALNPVSAQAILRVKVPDGLDLDAWINDPMPEESLSFNQYDVCPLMASTLLTCKEPWMDDEDPYNKGYNNYNYSGTGGMGPSGSGGGFGGMW